MRTGSPYLRLGLGFTVRYSAVGLGFTVVPNEVLVELHARGSHPEAMVLAELDLRGGRHVSPRGSLNDEIDSVVQAHGLLREGEIGVPAAAAEARQDYHAKDNRRRDLRNLAVARVAVVVDGGGDLIVPLQGWGWG